MGDIVDRCAAVWDRKALEAELAQASAKMVEQAAEIERLEAEAKTRTLDYLGQVGQLSEELERVKREAERAQDAHGVRFLNYLEETARLADEITRLQSSLETAADRIQQLEEELAQCQQTLYRQIGLTIQASEDATKASAARIEQLEAELLGEVTELSRRRMQVDNQAARIQQLEAALEVCDRVLHFDLRGMITWGKDYNQAVKDAADCARAALGEKP